MTDNKNNLILFEAIELRNLYDRQIKLLDKLSWEGSDKSDRIFGNSREEEKEPADDFNSKEMDKQLKSIQTKRVKLNQAIQRTNYENSIEYLGEKVTIAEALEIRKNLISDLEAISNRVQNSAYNRILHKEERDIVHKPKHSFQSVYDEFNVKLKSLRDLINMIHRINHQAIVQFKDEE